MFFLNEHIKIIKEKLNKEDTDYSYISQHNTSKQLLIINSGQNNMQGENIEWLKMQHETMVMMHTYIICNSMERTHLYLCK